MSRLSEELGALHREILSKGENERLLLQPRLGRLIERLDAAGEVVPAGIRTLNDELSDEVIEAQFDNMPV
jgi:hypothetical protein